MACARNGCLQLMCVGVVLATSFGLCSMCTRADTRTLLHHHTVQVCHRHCGNEYLLPSTLRA